MVPEATPQRPWETEESFSVQLPRNDPTERKEEVFSF